MGDETVNGNQAGITSASPLRALEEIGERRVGERLPSLLHELSYYRLVERTGAGEWVLRPDVQSALEAQERTVDGLERRVFVGLRCEQCQSRTMTSMIGERRLCESCAGAEGRSDPPGLDPDAKSPVGQPRRRRLPYHLRRAG
jgi:hypothetical protein